MSIASTAITQHSVTRLAIATGMAFESFREAFEKAAPVFDSAAIEEITARGGSWDAVRSAVAANAPHDLMVFSSIYGPALMAAAGHRTPSVQYQLGNHVIAEQMLRYSPLAVLYAPLRILVYSDEPGDAVFVLDQPSTLFASLEDPRITSVGHELDNKVSTLLAVIGIDAKSAFTSRDQRVQAI